MRELGDINSQLGRVRKRGDRFELSKFEILNVRKSLFFTLEVTSCKRETEASSDYIFFKVASIHPTHLYIPTIVK
jgi:hypothetical protein